MKDRGVVFHIDNQDVQDHEKVQRISNRVSRFDVSGGRWEAEGCYLLFLGSLDLVSIFN
jgi:hypothetical protein